MARVKDIDELLKNAREEVVKRSALVVKRMVEGEDIDKEEMAELKKLKNEIKFIEKTQADLNGGKPKEGKNGQLDLKGIAAQLKDISNSMGSIVADIPTSTT